MAKPRLAAQARGDAALRHGALRRGGGDVNSVRCSQCTLTGGGCFSDAVMRSSIWAVEQALQWSILVRMTQVWCILVGAAVGTSAEKYVAGAFTYPHACINATTVQTTPD